MTQTTDRDAINPEILAQAVAVYRWNDDEADIALEAVLLEQGVIAPHEIVELIEPIVNERLLGLFIQLTDGTMFSVTVGGAVHVVA